MNNTNTDVKDIVCDFDNLYNALLKCKRNVLWKDSIAGYYKNALANCYKLRQQLLNDTYTIDTYTKFTVYEPKERAIVSTRIKDRVFQRSLCDNYLYHEMTKSFIYDKFNHQYHQMLKMTPVVMKLMMMMMNYLHLLNLKYL